MGTQGRPPQEGLLGQAGYFELKAIKTQKTQEDTWTSPPTSAERIWTEGQLQGRPRTAPQLRCDANRGADRQERAKASVLLPGPHCGRAAHQGRCTFILSYSGNCFPFPVGSQAPPRSPWSRMTHIPHSPSLPSPYIIKSCFFSCYSVSCQFVRPTRRTWRGGGNAFLPNRCANTCCLGFHFFPVRNCSGAAGSFSGSVSDFLRNPDRPPLSGPVPAGPPRLSQPHTAVRCHARPPTVPPTSVLPPPRLF